VTYRVRMALRAESDAEETYGWIAEHEGRPLEALRWLDGLENAIASLREHPLRCPLAQEASFFE
jgi:plasmid stabilization system protein ParE